MKTEEALAVLNLKPPFSPNHLKTAYRRAAREEHPDHSKHPEAGDRFRRVQQAYEQLFGNGEVLEFTESMARATQTDDGTLLSELGKGLGPSTNGRPCDDCSGAGYRSYIIGWVACTSCPIGLPRRCGPCKGTGTFQRPGRRAQRCNRCDGRGRLQDVCKVCNGRMRVPDPNQSRSYSKCLRCKGCGELMVFNPVLPKGLLAGFK